LILIYGAPRSRAFRVLWTLEELDLPYELIPTSSAEARAPELLQLNPTGVLPTLVDGKNVLWESLAINLYLCEKYGGELWPTSVDARGHALNWTFWAINQIEAPVDAASRAGSALPSGWLEGPLCTLDARLKAEPHLLEGGFTVADLNVCAMFLRPSVARIDLAPFPALQDWILRCTARAAFRRMERHTLPPDGAQPTA
jgi:glutathione S-transferase